MSKRKPKLPKRKMGEGDYTEDRKAWAATITLEDLRREHAKQGDDEAVAALRRARKRRKAD